MVVEEMEGVEEEVRLWFFSNIEIDKVLINSCTGGDGGGNGGGGGGGGNGNVFFCLGLI